MKFEKKKSKFCLKIETILYEICKLFVIMFPWKVKTVITDPYLLPR